MGNATRETDILEVGGQEYTVSALGLAELESLETYVQGRAIAAGRASLPEGIDQETESRMMQPVIQYAMGLAVTGKQGFLQLMNPGGMVRLMYYSIKRNHSDITLQKCRELLSDIHYQQEIIDVICRVNKLKYQPKEPAQKHPSGSGGHADRQVADTPGPEHKIRDAAERDRGVVAEPIGDVPAPAGGNGRHDNVR